MLKTYCKLILSAFAGVMIFYSPANAQRPNDKMAVQVNNINKVAGKIVVSVFNGPEGFLEEGRALAEYSFPVSGKSMKVEIPRPAGAHVALALYHDVNNDGKCNHTMIGMPKEPYGFSRNFKPVLSAPKFDEVKLPAATTGTVSIRMIDP